MCVCECKQINIKAKVPFIYIALFTLRLFLIESTPNLIKKIFLSLSTKARLVLWARILSPYFRNV